MHKRVVGPAAIMLAGRVCGALLASVALLGACFSCPTTSSRPPMQTAPLFGPRQVVAPPIIPAEKAASRLQPEMTKRPFAFYYASYLVDSGYVNYEAAVDLPSGHVSYLDCNFSCDFSYPPAIYATGKSMLYMSNPPQIFEYALGQPSPTLTFDGECTGAIAASPNDDLFAIVGTGSSSTYCSTIGVYKPGSTTPYRTISTGVYNPSAMTIHDGDLYLSNGNDVVIYPHARAKPGTTITDGISGAFSFAFDKQNRLLVLNGSSVTIYPPGATSPITTITDGINAPTSLAVGPTGTVYVSSYSSGTITEYDDEQPTLSRTIGIQPPLVIAVDQKDGLYALAQGSGYVYSPFPSYVWHFRSKETSPNRKIEVNVGMRMLGAGLGAPW